MKSWIHRIKIRIKELGITQEEVASKMGITRGAITHYLAGRRTPSLYHFQKLSLVLKCDPAWLQFGVSPIKSSELKLVKEEKQKSSLHSIPILLWDQIQAFRGVSQLNKKEIKEWVQNFYTDKKNWFALRIDNDSMTTYSGNHSFREGEIVLIDPDKKAVHKSFVIALLPGDSKATFKQFVIDGNNHFLKPLNQQYQVIPIKKDTHFCGVVMKSLNEVG